MALAEDAIQKFSGNGKPGNPLCSFNCGFLTLHIYLNLDSRGNRYYDTVIYRRIKTSKGTEYKRGANLKPADIESAILLLQEAKKYLASISVL